MPERFRLVRRFPDMPDDRPLGADGSHSVLIGDAAFFAALLSTAIALGGALAHALELPNKIGLPGNEYFIVQQAYRGWNLLAIVIAVQLVSLIVAAISSRRRPRVLRPCLAAILFLVGAQFVFWTWTYPANLATENWTFMPADWPRLRRQWEYSHLAGAAFQLLAMISVIVAALARARR